MAIKKANNMKEIGENLQRIYDFKSIKQKDAAELLGVTPST
jgi:predicted XRE-type DNA-binding protein